MHQWDGELPQVGKTVLRKITKPAQIPPPTQTIYSPPRAYCVGRCTANNTTMNHVPGGETDMLYREYIWTNTRLVPDESSKKILRISPKLFFVYIYFF